MSRVSTVDERGGFLPQEAPPPGDPLRDELPFEKLTWTLACDGHWNVRSVALGRTAGHLPAVMATALHRRAQPMLTGLPSMLAGMTGGCYLR